MSLTKATYSMIQGAPINVRDFGAKGDAVTDDTAAIQAAIDYCVNLGNRKQTLYFPANEAAAYYKVTAPLTVTGRLSIVGDGQFSTSIYGVGLSAGEFVIDYDMDAADVVYFSEISNITIANTTKVANGVRLNNISYMLMKQVYISTCEVGLYITGTNCFSNSFEEVTIYDMGNECVLFENFTGGGQYMFNGCSFVKAVNSFVIASTAATDSLVLECCNFEQNTTTDMYVVGTVNGLSVIGCRSEGFDGNYLLQIAPTSPNYVYGLNVIGMFVTTDAGNSTPVYLSGDVKGFSITGCDFGYTAFQQMVYLNGAGEAGVVSGNYAPNAPKVFNVARKGVTEFANYNSSGALHSSFTATATGMTTSPTGTVTYTVIGNAVTMDIPVITGISNATTFTLTGAPTAIAPATDKDLLIRVIDNGSNFVGFARVKTTGVIELYASISGGAFTASGTKSVNTGSISYTLA